MHVAHPTVDGFAPAARPSSAKARVSTPRGSIVTTDVAREIPRLGVVDRPVQQAVAEVKPAERSEMAARVLNLVVASVALVALLPLMALIALAIRLTSNGPVFYSQVRVGLDRRWKRPGIGHTRRQQDIGGKPFTMWKFRTMVVDAEKNGQAVWASKKDPRVTAIGRVLRATRLDELPQLWNVVRGEMNIVGPRPERPSLFAELRDDIPGYALRQRVKPGITGWAQINQDYDTCLDDVRRKVSLDLEYLQQQSLAKDLRIMSLTLPVMLLRKGGW